MWTRPDTIALKRSHKQRGSETNRAEKLNNPDVLYSGVISCCTAKAKNNFATTSKITIGPVSATFEGRCDTVGFGPAKQLKNSGQGEGGVAGFAKGGAAIRTAIRRAEHPALLDVEANVGGELHSLGLV